MKELMSNAVALSYYGGIAYDMVVFVTNEQVKLLNNYLILKPGRSKSLVYIKL